MVKIDRSYVDAMANASEIIRVENPDFVVAPMLGSIPFIDAMTIIDKDFDPTRVVYMPASSHLPDVNDIMKDWLKNFLNQKITDSSQPV